MDFTPQQLAGAGKYSASVRIGNWNEDAKLSEIQKKSASHKKQQGLRLIDGLGSKTWAGAQPPILSMANSEGFIRYGSSIELWHNETSRRLASNIAQVVDNTQPGMMLFQCSGTENASLRSCFEIQPVIEGKELVELGDEVYLLTHVALRVNPDTGLAQDQFYLMSAGSSMMGSLSQSNQQEALIAQVTNPRTAPLSKMRWRIQDPEGEDLRFGADKRIMSGSQVRIVHSSTGKALALKNEFKAYSAYGVELDAYCSLEHRTSKVSCLRREHSGKRNPDQRLPVLAPNVWELRTAEVADCEAKESESCSLERLTPEAIVQVVRCQLNGFELLESHLKGMDVAQDGVIDYVDFKYGLQDYGVRLSEDELKYLFGLFSTNGGINISQFLSALSEC